MNQPYPTKYTNPFILYPPALWTNMIGSSFAEQHLGLHEQGGDFVLYVSIPFCRVRCHSCPYFVELLSTKDVNNKEDRYVDALVADIRRWGSYRRFSTGTLRSIYLGGGTGTILTTQNLRRVVEAIYESFPVAQGCSLTLEGNARDYTEDKLDYVANSEITRVSLGVQSFNAEMLRVIGSPHAADASIEVIKQLRRRGMENIQMDMMYNLPGHNQAIWRSDLVQMKELGVKHFTIYLYRIHEDTPQANFIATGKFPKPADKESSFVRSLYSDATQAAREVGYEMYMFDHFAQPGYANDYNEWTFKRSALVEVLGVGPGAYGFINRHRIGVKKDVKEYMETCESGHHMITSVSEQLSPRILRERFIINVLQYFAVDLALYRREFGSEFVEDFAAPVARLVRKELVTLSDDRMEMTALGREWHMNVMLEFANDKFWNDARSYDHPHWAMNTPMVDLFAGHREAWLGDVTDEPHAEAAHAM